MMKIKIIAVMKKINRLMILMMMMMMMMMLKHKSDGDYEDDNKDNTVNNC